MCTGMRSVAASGLVLLLFASACSCNNPTDADLDLLSAVDRTMTAESFHVTLVQKLEGVQQAVGSDYVAPDRFSTRGVGTRTLVVGTNQYISEPDDLDRFSLMRLPCPVTIDEVFPAFASLSEAEAISRVGGTYIFKIDALAEGARGRARIEDGHLVSLSLHFTLPLFGDEPVEEQYTFSDFGDPMSIERPPPSRVVDDSRFEDGIPFYLYDGSPAPCP